MDEKTIKKYKNDIKRYEERVSHLSSSVYNLEKSFETYCDKNGFDLKIDDYVEYWEGVDDPWKEKEAKIKVMQLMSDKVGFEGSTFEIFGKFEPLARWSHELSSYAEAINSYNTQINEKQQEIDKSGISQPSIALKPKLAEKGDVAKLRDVLESVMADFKVVWFQKMEEWHRYRYNHIKSVTPDAKEWARRYKRFYYDKMGYRFFRRHSTLESRFELKNKDCMATITDPANRYKTEDEYIEQVKKDLEMDWQIDMRTLADKCNKFGLDLDNVKVTNPSVTPKGFQCFITDGKPRVIDVRMIWAAEHSDYVKPHTRYIVTERKTR